MVEGGPFTVSQPRGGVTAEKLHGIFKIICQTVKKINAHSVAHKYALYHCAFAVARQ